MAFRPYNGAFAVAGRCWRGAGIAFGSMIPPSELRSGLGDRYLRRSMRPRQSRVTQRDVPDVSGLCRKHTTNVEASKLPRLRKKFYLEKTRSYVSPARVLS